MWDCFRSKNSDTDLELQKPLQTNESNEPDPPNDILLKAILRNNEVEVVEALKSLSKKDFQKKWEYSGGQRNVLSIATQDERVGEGVLAIVLKEVVNKYGDEEFCEGNWYHWQPIHFASYDTNVSKLRTIVDILKNTPKLNSSTILSENALHVLLEHGRRMDSFNVQLTNGWESRICHVIAQEKQDIVACAEVLIDAGIDVNHTNIWNETPLIIAIRYRLLRVIEKILRSRRDVDLDTSKDLNSGKSARDLLRENEICSSLLSPNTVTVSPTKALFSFLKNRDEELFLRYNNENIEKFVDQLDNDNPNSPSMLQLCLIKGYIDYEKTTPVFDPECDILKTPMMKFFCHSGMGRSIEHLLNNGADILKKTHCGNVFKMATKLNYYPFLVMLLEHRSGQVSKGNILDVLQDVRCDGSDGNVRFVLLILLGKLEEFYNKQDFIDYEILQVLNQILQYYLQSGDYRDNICQVLRLGASVAQPSKLERISYDTLKQHLDESINANNDVSYNSLIRDEKDVYSETEALHFLAHDPKKCDLINHPSLVYFIHAKWLKSSKFFYLNLAFYGVFVAVLYVYMTLLQNKLVPLWLTVVFLICLLLLTIKEVLQVILYRKKYFKDWSNYPELAVIACCLYVTSPVTWLGIKQVYMVISILLSTVIFLLLLGQLPQFTKYMIIFSSTKYFLEYVVFYFIQFVSFALCFYILLPPKDSENVFGDIMVKLFDTLIFFIGQYDGPITDPPNFPIFGRIIVAIFVFCMTIILNNLLVGLIVTDMDLIQKTSKQQRQRKMISYIRRIEVFLKSIDKTPCFKFLKYFFGNTKLFKKGENKVVTNIRTCNFFDEDDKVCLKEIHINRLHDHKLLRSLYEFIISEIYLDRSSVRDNRDILFKLTQLEDQLRRNRPR